MLVEYVYLGKKIYKILLFLKIYLYYKIVLIVSELLLDIFKIILLYDWLIWNEIEFLWLIIYFVIFVCVWFKVN